MLRMKWLKGNTKMKDGPTHEHYANLTGRYDRAGRQKRSKTYRQEGRQLADRDERETDRKGQMDMQTQPDWMENLGSQVDKHGGDCQVTRLQVLWSAHVTPSVRQEDCHLPALQLQHHGHTAWQQISLSLSLALYIYIAFVLNVNALLFSLFNYSTVLFHFDSIQPTRILSVNSWTLLLGNWPWFALEGLSRTCTDMQIQCSLYMLPCKTMEERSRTYGFAILEELDNLTLPKVTRTQN